MYPKGSKSDNQRSAKPPKRKFHGNQYTREKTASCESSTSKKLNTSSSNDVIVNVAHCYRIIEFLSVFGTVAEFLICKTCRCEVKFGESGHQGLGFKINVMCSCGTRNIFSGPLIHTGFEINRRIVFVMRFLGVGNEGINLFCGLMDLCQGISHHAYLSIVDHIHSAAKILFNKFSVKAVEEEKQKNEENGRSKTDLKVSGDGSWKKRGYTSLYGVTTLIGYYSGKVLDLIVKSSFCQLCLNWKSKEKTAEYIDWYEQHKEKCNSNHEGSAGKMEVDSINEMFASSIEKFGVKYVNYIGDGDSKTFSSIVKNNPYGDGSPVVKSECVGHVQKRMGSRLRNIKKKNKLGGKGRLTEVLIKKLTIYYGLAIRRNVNSVKEMKKAIMATLYHFTSTDEKPKHDNCPAGADSWCEWQKAKALEELATFTHPPCIINPDVEKYILPIYEDLSKDDLLCRCLGGHTQNANESFNATVWRIAPKHLNSGSKIVQIAAYIAAGIFNEGFTAVLTMMEILDLKIGQQCKIFADKTDETRITRAEQRQRDCTKEARSARRAEQMQQNEFFEKAEGCLYGPGVAD